MHVTNAYIQAALDDGLDLPALAWAGWLNSLGFTLSYPLVGTFLLLLFPDGRLPSPRWRLVGWAAAGGIFLFSLGFALLPGPYYDYEGVENPLGIEALEPILGGAIILGGVTIGASTVASAVSLVVRWRRATGVARQQLKWISWAAIMVGASFAVVAMTMATGYGESVVNDVAWTAGIAAIIAGLPVVTGIAILRHRLFDIDRIINRTLVYGLLTTMLGAAYLGLILASNSVVTGAAGGDTPDLVIAGATLAVAALFQPLRRRIQRVVDRRFYRNTYDAARTINIFSARLREEVDLESLEGELRAIVRETMQPSHVSLWLRPVK
jgi:MFS family permease